jgi:hypothetical protein
MRMSTIDLSAVFDHKDFGTHQRQYEVHGFASTVTTVTPQRAPKSIKNDGFRAYFKSIGFKSRAEIAADMISALGEGSHDGSVTILKKTADDNDDRNFVIADVIDIQNPNRELDMSAAPPEYPKEHLDLAGHQ